MTEFAKIILAILLALPSHYLDTEDDVQREERLTIIAKSIDKASSLATCTDEYKPTKEKPCEPIFKGSKKQIAYLLVTIGFWESRFAQNVHEGKCKSWQCDAVVYKDVHGNILRVIHKAKTPWQMQQTSIVENEWRYMEGADQKSTNLAAWAAAKNISRGYSSCGNAWGAISKYAGVKHCNWEKGKDRVRFYEKLMRNDYARETAKETPEKVASKTEQKVAAND